MSRLPKCSVVGCNELSDPCWFVHVGGECYPACDAHGGERIPKERLRPMCGKAHEYVTVVREAVKCDLDPQHQNQHEADTTLSGRICWSDANEKITDAIRIKDLREEVRRYEGRMSSLIVHLFDLRLLFTAVDIAEGDMDSMCRELATICGGPGKPRDGETRVAYWLRRVSEALIVEMRLREEALRERDEAKGNAEGYRVMAEMSGHEMQKAEIERDAAQDRVRELETALREVIETAAGWWLHLPTKTHAVINRAAAVLDNKEPTT